MVPSGQTKNKGLWTTGRLDALEHHKLQSLIETGVRAAKEGHPFKYEDPLIIFETKRVDATVHIFYSWKFPPEEYWSKETKTKKECPNCLPNGFFGEAKREVWCVHLNYDAPKCPYGVPTPHRCYPLTV